MTFHQRALIVGNRVRRVAVRQVMAPRRDDETLDLSRRHAADRSGSHGLVRQYSLGDVIAVAGAALVGMAWAHAVATLVEHAAAQEGGRGSQPAPPLNRPSCKPRLHGREQRTIEDRFMITLVSLAAVDHLADVEAVLEQIGERPHPEAAVAGGATVRSLPRLAADAAPVEVGGQCPQRTQLKIMLKDGAHRLSLSRHHDDSLVHRRIAERDRASDPNAPALGGGDLVAHPLANHLALELGKGQQDVEREPPHRGRGVELLRHRDKRDRLGIEQLDQLGKISQRAGQTVDLVHHHNIDLAVAHVRQQRLQGWPGQRCTGQAAVVIAVRQQAPAFMGLALDISLTGLALGIQRGESEVEVMLARLAGIDGAARELSDIHGAALLPNHRA